MCFFNSSSDTPAMPAEYAAAKSPDAGAVRDSRGRRTLDQLQASTPTVLTGSTAFDAATTNKKTLLGQ